MKVRNILQVMFLLLLALAVATVVYAGVYNQPTGPDTFTPGTSTRKLLRNNTPIQAEAGNVTAVNMWTQRSTQAWQGYYGNVSGEIVLDDMNNQTFYMWALDNPGGEVYAANHTTIAWANVYCVNFTATGKATAAFQKFNQSTLEGAYGINITDNDGFDETFNRSFDSQFFVGGVNIDANSGCSMANMFVDEAWQATLFKETILTDNDSVIFTTLLQSNENGFKSGAGDTADFQMLVPENGHPGYEATTTTYYFFVELD